MAEIDDVYVNIKNPLKNTQIDISKLKIFKDSNVIIEETMGMTLESDVYTASSTDLNSIISDFQEFDNMTSTLENNVETPKNLTTEDKVNAMVLSVHALDQFGHALVKGNVCPVCGKVVKFMPRNGFCSISCFQKDFAAKVFSHLRGEYPDTVENTVKDILAVLNMCNFVINTIAKLPDLLANLVKLPPQYREYATLRINLAFVRLKILIDKLMIKKNELLIKLLKRIKFGAIDDTLQPLFENILAIIQMSISLKIALNESIGIILTIMLDPLFSLAPLSYGFFMTPKSFMNSKTSGKFVIPIPFDTSKSSIVGAGTLIAAGFGASAMCNINYELIDSIIQSIFLPITEPEYLLDPEVFKVRLALSDLNTASIKDTIQTLETLCVLGGDYLPRYHKLSLSNIWFVIAILSGWGPVSLAIFGDFIFHSNM